MNNSNNNPFNILDLPNEILFKIFKKLNMIDVLYSITDVNERFNRLALDSFYVRDLEMTSMMDTDTFYNQISSVDTEVLSRICENILPKICHQIHKLTVDQNSMKATLHAANYSQLDSLSMINFQEEVLYEYLTRDSILRDLLAKQITHVDIDIKCKFAFDRSTALEIFQLILSLCQNLTTFDFGDILYSRKRVVSFDMIRAEYNISSTLMKLQINVLNFFDLRYLLDGRFNCLSTLIITVTDPYGPTDIFRKKELSTLKCFTLIGSLLLPAFCYDSFIVPLLSGMINLDELRLSLRVARFNSTYIDGNQFYDQFLVHMTQLKIFTFDIKTKVRNTNVGVELLSHEDIQHSFLGRDYQQVYSYVNTNSLQWDSECHFYSLPYDFEYFYDLDNSFQGGMFHKVRQLKMKDTIPFEQKLFQRISEDFPSLKYFHIVNGRAMKEKSHVSTLIKFPSLKFLDLHATHKSYALLFLLKEKMHLPRMLHLCIGRDSLQKITKNFTNDPMHWNFDKLETLHVGPLFVRPKNFHVYFPLLSACQ